jgi:hypothetical protein
MAEIDESMLVEPNQSPDPSPASVASCITLVNALLARVLQSPKGLSGTTLRWAITVCNVAPAGVLTSSALSAKVTAKHAMRYEVIVSNKPPRANVVGPWNGFPLLPQADCRDSIAKSSRMCRNIKTLHNFAPPATDDEIRASAIQFVRKLSGFTHPSKANEAAFDHAVAHVTDAARELLASLVTNAPPRNREEEAHKAKERSRLRFVQH